MFDLQFTYMILRAFHFDKKILSREQKRNSQYSIMLIIGEQSNPAAGPDHRPAGHADAGRPQVRLRCRQAAHAQPRRQAAQHLSPVQHGPVGNPRGHPPHVPDAYNGPRQENKVIKKMQIKSFIRTPHRWIDLYHLPL